MICRSKSTIWTCKTDIGRLRKSIFSKGSFFWILQAFGSLGEPPQRSLAAEKASFWQLKALTEKMLTVKSLFSQILSNFAQIADLLAEMAKG